MIINDSSDTPESSARQAEKEFGNMLPLGMKFRVGVTPGGRKRLQIKNGRKDNQNSEVDISDGHSLTSRGGTDDFPGQDIGERQDYSGDGD